MIELAVIVICILANAALTCYEMAFITVSRRQLREKAQAGNRRAAALLRHRQTPERTLSILQVGITMVSLISAAVGGAGAVEWFVPYIREVLDVSFRTAEAIAIAGVVLPLTFATVVIGELVPKAFALRRALPIALFGANALGVVARIFAPIVDHFEGSTAYILKWLMRRQKKSQQH